MTNETDRELLELAAKAAGADWAMEEDGQFEILSEIGGVSGYWNPLTDDGDALRLAVRLRLGIEHNHPLDTVNWVQVSNAEGMNLVSEEFDCEPCTATRHAIVRAAAEIWRAMK